MSRSFNLYAQKARLEYILDVVNFKIDNGYNADDVVTYNPSVIEFHSIEWYTMKRVAEKKLEQNVAYFKSIGNDNVVKYYTKCLNVVKHEIQLLDSFHPEYINMYIDVYDAECQRRGLKNELFTK